MPLSKLFFAILAASMATAASGSDAGTVRQPPEANSAQAVVKNSRQFDFVSKINGESYRVQVALPYEVSPPGGYPILYVLDGNRFFGTFAGATMTRANVDELDQVVVVGIASGDGPKGADRTLDFTSTSTTAYEKIVDKEFDPDQRLGGAERFLRVIKEEIAPQVGSVTRINWHRQSIFGWSLGGLFVVRTMLSHPEAFANYLAVSPSLFLGGREAFRAVPGFAHRLTEEGLHPRIFIAVGALEADPSINPLPKMSQADWARESAYIRMVGNAKDMHEALGVPFASRTRDNELRILDGDTHASDSWTAINPALDFALGRGRFAGPR